MTTLIKDGMTLYQVLYLLKFIKKKNIIIFLIIKVYNLSIQIQFLMTTRYITLYQILLRMMKSHLLLYCKYSNFINRHHGNILTGDLRITENDKLRKIISTGPNYTEPKAINLKKCKDNIITEIENLIEGKLSSGKNITNESSSPWKNTIIE